MQVSYFSSVLNSYGTEENQSAVSTVISYHRMIEQFEYFQRC